MARRVVKAKMRISATSLEPNPASRLDGLLWCRRQAGFTLLELLVALAIAGLTLTVTPSLFGKAQETIQYRSTVRSVVGELRKARVSASTQGVSSFFHVNLLQRQFGSDVQKQQSLPDALEMRVTVGDQQLAPGGQNALIEFLPDGGATGGSIDIVRRSGEGTRVRVDWISSQIELEPLSK
jgi:general secretion pathway protein H